MGTNPYRYGDDPDADLFGDAHANVNGHKHTIDGTICPTCLVVHDVESLPVDVPDEALDVLLSMFDDLPDDVVKKMLQPRLESPKSSQFITAYLGFFNDMEHGNTLAPTLRAVVEVLDKMTDGEITRRAEFYNAERELIAAHLALKSVNTVLDDATTAQAPKELIAALDFVCDYTMTRISSFTNEYREIAERYGFETHDSIIQGGIYPEGMDPMIQGLMVDEFHGVSHDDW